MKVQITIDGIKFDMPADFKIGAAYKVTTRDGHSDYVCKCGECSLFPNGQCSQICRRYAEELIRRTPKVEEVDDVR